LVPVLVNSHEERFVNRNERQAQARVLLEVDRVSKTFGTTTVLSDVSFELRVGEVLAVLGHNGSGKSTLVKILAGVHEADAGGEIRVADGEDLHFIHQDLGLVNTLSAIENLNVVSDVGWRGLMPLAARAERRRAREAIARFGGNFDVTVPLSAVSPAERAIVAIARALGGWEHAERVLVLDEPTAALHGNEVQTLLSAVKRLAAEGAAVIFISHRLDEVMGLADRVLVLRDGHVAANVRRGEFDHDGLVRLIAGRDLSAQASQRSHRRHERALGVRGLTGPRVRGLDFDLHEGEILGVSGNIGSGRERVAGMLFGAAEATGGELEVAGTTLAARDLSPATAIRLGIGFLPADRAAAGAVMTMTSRENLTLPRLEPFRRHLRRQDHRLERRETARWLDKLDVKPPELERTLQLFSGGNQQKIVLAKWLRLEPRVLLLDEPTQGVDVGAKASIYEFIISAAATGAAVLVSSSEAKELAMLCDRAIVMRDGEAVAEVPRPLLTESRLIRESLGTMEEPSQEIDARV
jgi:ABC-type sugar transport system ATPase subunit